MYAFNQLFAPRYQPLLPLAMPPPKSSNAKPPSFRTAAAAASIKQRQQQLQMQQQMQMQQAQMFQAPPGYALVPLQQPPPPTPVFSNANVSRPSAAVSFQCRWVNCRAAQSNRPTLGDLPHCYSCLRPKGQAMSPPADKVAPQQQVLTVQTREVPAPTRASAPHQKPVRSAVPGAELPQTPAQRRAAKRARQRLARANEQEVTNGSTPANLSPAAKAAAALKEVTAKVETPTERPAGSLTAEVFKDKKDAAKKIHVEQQVQDDLARLSHLATLVVQSLQGEYLPAPPTTPEGESAAQKELRLREAATAMLDGTLEKQGSASLANPLALQKAEAELSVTNRALQPLLDSGLSQDDQVVKLLREKQTSQMAAISKLKAGAPSVAAQKVALAVGKQKLLEQQTLLADRVAKGKKAAQERMNVRDQLLAQLTSFLDQLSEATDAADSALAAAHDARTEQREQTLHKALELCAERELALEDVVFHDTQDSAPTATKTEQERDAAKAVATEHQAITQNLQQQLAQLQQAASAATQQDNLQQQQQQQQAAAASAEAAAATAAAAAAAHAAEAHANTDWWTDFPAEESQLPKVTTARADEQETAFILRLLVMKQAAKFASQPRMTFQQLLVAPWFIHRLVGDTIWNACWAERAPRVSEEMTVPQKLLNIALHAAASLEGEYNEKTTDEQRAAAVRTITERQEDQRKRARLVHAPAQPLPS